MSYEWLDNIITCPVCDKQFERKSFRHKFCSDDCRTFFYSMDKYKTGRFLILERDAFRCIYCGRSSFEDCATLAVDHIVPKSKNGKDTAGNLACVCVQCNSEKRDRELSADVIDELLRQIAKRNKQHQIDNAQLLHFK